jgi:hypothetical protein
MYLLDGVDDLGQDTENKKVRIADQGLFDYVCANASKRTDSKYRHVLRARITGTVDLDNDEIQLHQVSEAILSDDGRALRYESRG